MVVAGIGGDTRQGDPNFPDGGLRIAPSHVNYAPSNIGYQDQAADIEEYGIAGRIWEAAYLLTQYLSTSNDGGLIFDPPCSLLERSSHRQHILELGAGVGVAGIHLGLELSKASSSSSAAATQQSTLILTDLENVLPLLKRNVKESELYDTDNISVKVRSLPWGSDKDADVILDEISPNTLSHIICSDLVYFPELLAPLLRSLVYLTSTCSGVEVIIGYKLRSHSKEEPFWKAFGVWFEFAPVLCKGLEKDADWRRFGSRLCDSGRLGSDKDKDTPAEDEMFVFVAHRKKSTLDCTAPEDDEHLLGGWLLRDNVLEEGKDAETFELLLMNAIQD